MKQVVSIVVSAVVMAFVLGSCSPNNVITNNSLKKYFDEQGVTGTFGLFNNGSGEFMIYNLDRFKDSTFLPASTFKIVNSLIALETGRVDNEKTVIPWDGKIHVFPGGDTAHGWNKDLTLEEAFKASALPAFQEIARRIGKDTMQRWLDTLQYGNHKIGDQVDNFWINNTLQLTPDEEMGLVKRLYFGQLPFQKRTQDIVKKMMVQESNANYQLAYKTGWGFRENGDAIGWLVGWIEENRHPYFFVLNIEAPHDKDISKSRLAIVKAILKEEGFFEGKK